MRSLEVVRRKLNATAPKGLSAVLVVVAGLGAPAYFILLSPSWKQVWTPGAFIALGVYLAIIGGFALMAFGVTGGIITTPEKDKHIGDVIERYRARYRWPIITLLAAWVAYEFYKVYA
jgi:hypothetical protein